MVCTHDFWDKTPEGQVSHCNQVPRGPKNQCGTALYLFYTVCFNFTVYQRWQEMLYIMHVRWQSWLMRRSWRKCAGMVKIFNPVWFLNLQKLGERFQFGITQHTSLKIILKCSASFEMPPWDMRHETFPNSLIYCKVKRICVETMPKGGIAVDLIDYLTIINLHIVISMRLAKWRHNIYNLPILLAIFDEWNKVLYAKITFRFHKNFIVY